MAAAGAPAVASAQQNPQYYGHMWNGSWHGWFFGPLMMMLFLAVIVVVVVVLVRWLGGGHGGPVHPPAARTPLDILKERFARGEIDKDEFEERRRVLGE
jgi:putative membrane protein